MTGGLRYLSVCSGIEAATQAAHPLGWQAVAFSEIEPFPCAVLAHRYPHVPNWGDMTRFKEWPDATIDALFGGTPCQSFSVAGLRKGLDDPRGNLMLTFGGIAARYRPNWLVWENVPGVLSSNQGRDFGAFLWMLGQLGYGWAYRVLDAQHVRTRRFPFAVPQRRRRVFVVGYLGDWRRAAAVLFDRESLSGNPPPRRQAGQKPAPTISARPTGGGGLGTDFDLDGGLICADIAPTLNAHFGDKQGLEDQHINGGEGGASLSPPVANPLTARMHKGINTTLDEGQTLIANGGAFDVAHALRGEGFDASEDGTGRGTPIVPVAGTICRDSFAGGAGGRPEGAADGHFIPECTVPQTVAFDCKGSQVQYDDTGSSPTLRAMGHAASHQNAGGQLAIATPWAVRRLTPRECERLQGFPDDFTRIPHRNKPADLCPDGPRYKALGNSWAVNCAEWIFERIAEVDGWPEVKEAEHA